MAILLDLAVPDPLAYSQSIYITSFSLGVLLHLFVFKRGEWDHVGSEVLYSFILAYTVLAGGASLYLNVTSYDGFWTVIRFVSLAYLLLLSGLFTSMLLYRWFFHPLRRFPGPAGAKVSGAYVTRLVLKNMHYFEEAQKLHKTYGDFVRVGPNELSITHPMAISAIHAHSSPCLKGPWYNTQLPSRSLHTTRDRADHSRRRKVWDQGFSSKALRDYEPRVQHYTSKLLEQIEANSSKTIDASKLYNLYSFDVMGNLAFGKDFGLVESQEMHPSMSLLQATTVLSGMYSHVSWLLLVAKNFPGMASGLKRFEKWLEHQTKERMQNEPQEPDVFSWILKDYRKLSNPTPQQWLDLRGDAMLIVVAGSDTTAASLTCLFLNLCLHPDKCAQLQAEIDENFSQHGAFDHQSLSKLQYLQACIDESLRMYPPVPSGVQRQTPPQGLRVGTTFIPGNTIITIPSYTLNRDARLFPQPDQFIPERWLSRTELVKDKSVFAPFSIGRYSCVGKQLALMEMRTVTAHILHQYDVSLAKDQTLEDFTEGMVDGFTLSCPKLEVMFSPRTRKAE